MFSRRWIINYILIFLIVLFTYIGNRFDVETGYQPQQSVTSLKPESIGTMEIQTADAKLILRREEDGWMLESPIRWPANDGDVERLLGITSVKTDSRLAAEEIDLETLGLQFPKASLRLNETLVLFGDTNNIGARRYTMVGSTVYLLPDMLLPFMSQGLTGIVDQSLLPRRFELSALKLPGHEIIRDANNTWRLIDAKGIGQEQIAKLVDNWQNLQALRVKPFSAEKIPQQKITTRLADGRNHDFFVMSIDPEIVIANPQISLQYHFPADLYYQLISLRTDETSG
ncbi:MAG: DUF4340 domain-containing protein [Gammaproteobacteria bacterium]|nr:DUF4340 domain-containing protein [Gammaproteobacteria bacterium]MDH3857924.1 DUF4340 domain-containing protein [Gammaproteobacteria bacterium]